MCSDLQDQKRVYCRKLNVNNCIHSKLFFEIVLHRKVTKEKLTKTMKKIKGNFKDFDYLSLLLRKGKM